MLYPVPFEYHEFVVDRRGGRPARRRDALIRAAAGRRRSPK